MLAADHDVTVEPQFLVHTIRVLEILIFSLVTVRNLRFKVYNNHGLASSF